MKKSTAVTIITTISLLLIGAATMAISSAKRVNSYERSIAASYRHAFSEIVNGVSELDNSLQKSVIVTSTSLAGSVCMDVYAKSQTTAMALGTLPFSATELEKTAGFINTVGDYSFCLAQKAARGESLSAEERDSLKKLSETAKKLADAFRQLESEMGSEMVGIREYERTLREYDNREAEFIPETFGDRVCVSEQEFSELPVLIYDGPFSEHLKDSSPRLLEGMEEISAEEGRKIAADFLGARVEKVFPTGETAGLLPALCYETEIGGAQVNIRVTKVGGVVANALNSRVVESKTLSPTEAQTAAGKMLERWGFENMKPSYYAIYGNVLTANFAYEKDGIICYPDLIKVGIAMDNGSLQSFEATGYISSHGERMIPSPSVNLEDARTKIPEDCEIESGNPVIIPSPGEHEILCYEFLCREGEDRRFIVYVNAQTGEQEKILILLEDEDGFLTI